MYVCTVVVDGLRVAFESSRDLASVFLRLAETPTFLGFGIFPQISLGEYSVRYDESRDETVVEYSSKNVVIRAPWDAVQRGETLLYAALPFIELQWQQQGFVTIHAAAVSLNAKAVLILGKEGSGKTTTALGLCRSYGGRLIGNDLVVVGSASENGEIVTRSGTKFLSFRRESIQRNIPDLLHLFPEGNEDSWLQKVLVHPPKVNIKMCDGEVPLGNAYFVHVDETKNDLFVKSANNVVNRLYLNENFSRYIRCTCIALLDDKLRYLGYVPSFDSKVLFAKRAKIIERLFSEYSMKFVSGPLGKVVDYIVSES
ncbi:MAG: hypothetical protein NTY93_01205 [Candidatus Kaiserbacteria bacterium]|nr:hypothetical protein [Candidatus Kaiserbacteria bacterium]